MYKLIVCQCYLNKAVNKNNDNKHQIPGLYPSEASQVRRSGIEPENLYLSTCLNDSSAQLNLETNGSVDQRREGSSPKSTPSTILYTQAFFRNVW